ncbi:MAG: hypothetical protein AB1921_20120 [Thermodesulfobacteriota bacterium]
MNDIEMRTFRSPGEVARTFADLLRGPTFAGTFLSLDQRFREELILSFSIGNNCML